MKKKKKYKRLALSWSASSESYPRRLRTYLVIHDLPVFPRFHLFPWLSRGYYPLHYHSFSDAIHEQGVGVKGNSLFNMVSFLTGYPIWPAAPRWWLDSRAPKLPHASHQFVLAFFKIDLSRLSNIIMLVAMYTFGSETGWSMSIMRYN